MLKCSHCENKAQFRCDCSSSLLLCQVHLSLHLCINAKHFIVPITTPIPPDELLEIHSKLKNRISHILSCKNRLQTEAASLIQDIHNQLKHVLDHLDRYLNVYLGLIKKDSFSDPELEIFMELKQSELVLDPAITKPPNKKISEYFNQDWLKEYKNSEINKILSGQNPACESKKPKDNFISSEKICYFEQNSKFLVTVTVTSENDSKKQLEIPENQSVDAGTCQLSEADFFVLGGTIGNNFKETGYIINIPTSSIQQTTVYPARKAKIGCCALFNQSVYVFGGSTLRGPSKECESFNLSSNAWTKLADLPIASELTSTQTVSEEILIGTFKANCIYKYEVFHNNFKSYGALSVGPKVLVSGLGQLFVFSNANVYESTDEELTQLQLIPKAIGLPKNAYLLSYPVRNAENWFFLLNNLNIYRFNLETKELKNIRRIKPILH
jgi:hypothetical protein